MQHYKDMTFRMTVSCSFVPGTDICDCFLSIKASCFHSAPSSSAAFLIHPRQAGAGRTRPCYAHS